MYKNQRGFTLLEVLLTVVIIGVLSAVIVPRFLFAKSESERKACYQNLAILNTQTEKFYIDRAVWPGSGEVSAMEDLLGGGGGEGVVLEIYLPDGEPKCPGGGEYTLDTDTHRWRCVLDATADPLEDLHGFVNSNPS